MTHGCPEYLSDGSFQLFVAPREHEGHRNSEGDVVELTDGRLLLVWSDFYTTDSSDDAASRASARLSSDGGRTWGEKFCLQENVGDNVMSLSLTRSQAGTILFCYIVKKAGTMIHYVRRSTDEARTWSDPIRCTPGLDICAINNSRFTQLRDGRLLLPGRDYFREHGALVRRPLCFYSDDDGLTWHRGQNAPDIPRRYAKDKESPAPPTFHEPGVVELTDGRLLMYARTRLGFIVKAYSSDRGLTWTEPEPEPMPLQSPESPQTCKRIPATGDLLLIWNNAPLPATKPWHGRTPLTAALSSDDGETWHHFRNLEDDPDKNSAYTSITFVGDRVLLTYGLTGPVPPYGTDLRFRSLPLDWFYSPGGA